MPHEVHEIIEIGRSVLSYPLIKMSVALSLGVSNFFFDEVLALAMWSLLALIVFDFITAIMAVYSSHEEIESRKIVLTVRKIVVYYVSISAGFLTEAATHNAIPLIDETIIGFLAVTELISILENTGKMGYHTPNKLLNRLREINDSR